MRVIVVLLMVWMGLHNVWSQSLCKVVKYDEEDGVPSNHVTQLLQDSHGFMWFSTWNGLCRFDGYEFQTFKTQAGDGCHMPNDRIRSIAIRPDGQIVCKVEENEYYMFNTRTCRFHDVAPQDIQQAADDIQKYRQSKAVKTTESQVTFEYDDRQGNHWEIANGQITLSVPVAEHTKRLSIEPAAEVKCLFKDSKSRYWLTTREDAAIRIYNSDMKPIGYLGRDGSIHTSYTSFGAPIYCMYETTDGSLWLGSKPQGLFRMQEKGGRFVISQPTGMSDQDVYNIKEDRFHRLWIATMREGLLYTNNYTTANPQFLKPRQYPKDFGQRVRHLYITRNGLLIAATTDGLVTAQLGNDVNKMTFYRHQRESDHAESLSCSATMDVIEDGNGEVWISTESGGVNMISEGDLLKPQPVFRHINSATHQLPNDIVLSLAPMNDRQTMVVSSHLLTLVDTTGHSRVLDARFFNADYRFGDARPLPFGKGQWLFGLKDGAFTTSSSQMEQKAYSPPLVLTYIEVRGEGEEVRGDWAVEYSDTIILQPHERNVSIHFAALDYSASERISYAFRLSTDKHWHYIGHDRSAILLDLKPGTYLLEIRSTNADGEWLDNIRTLTIIVTPTFWEAWYGQLLIVLLFLALLAAILYTYLYIRRIKRQHQQTLEAYLTLLNTDHGDGSLFESVALQSDDPISCGNGITQNRPRDPARDPEEAAPIVPMVKAEDDALLKRVMKFIEENIADADIGVGDLAAAAAVSRSGLQRKLKQTMGVTPQELLSEARIKRACQLLQQTDKSVAEVAYACGFSDPKYFSKCFKQSTGKTPSEYKNA